MFCRARYLTPDKHGETREERNERFGQSQLTPEWTIPDYGYYLFEWFEELNDGINRRGDGQVNRATWHDIDAWLAVKKNVVRPHEIAVLMAMDAAYCEALAGELEYAQAQDIEEAEAKRAQEAGRR